MLSIVEKETGIQLQAGLPDSNEQLLLTTMRMNHMCKQQTSKNRCYESISIKLKKKKTEQSTYKVHESNQHTGQDSVYLGQWLWGSGKGFWGIGSILPRPGAVHANAHFMMTHSAIQFRFFHFLYVLYFIENDLKSKLQNTDSTSPSVF